MVFITVLKLNSDKGHKTTDDVILHALSLKGRGFHDPPTR